MIKLALGASPDRLRAVLGDAAREIENVRGSTQAEYAIGLYNAYLEWASHQVRLMAGLLPDEEIDRLITTRRYWTLLSLEPSAVTELTLRLLVDGEISQRIEYLKSAQEGITSDLARWDSGAAAAVVLDTGVWLRHHENVAEVDWNTVLDIRPDVPLVITVPTKVIDELDGHKRNRQQVAKGQLSIRNRAGKALRFLELQFRAPGQRPKLNDGSLASSTPSSALYLGLIPQELSHSPLPDADLEIVDRALSARPYAKSVHVVTTDYGMVFRAKQAGLDVTRVADFEEALEEPIGAE